MTRNEQRPPEEAADTTQKGTAPPLIAQGIDRVKFALERVPYVGWSGHKPHARAALIYVYLAHNASKGTGRLTRSMKVIAKDTGCKERQVAECLDLLIKLGLLTRERDGKRHNQASDYTLRNIAACDISQPAKHGAAACDISQSLPAIERTAACEISPSNQEELSGNGDPVPSSGAAPAALRDEKTEAGSPPAATREAGMADVQDSPAEGPACDISQAANNRRQAALDAISNLLRADGAPAVYVNAVEKAEPGDLAEVTRWLSDWIENNKVAEMLTSDGIGKLRDLLAQIDTEGVLA